mgnify:FL=1
MQIDAYQSVNIYGWWAQPRLTLAWEDIKQKGFSWRQLRELGFGAEQLKTLQPDKTQWIQRGGLQLTDITDMQVFPVNPLTDFRADLAELWNLKCSPDQLVLMGVTYTQLLQRGLNPQIMFYFNFSLSDWMQLGMLASDVEMITPQDCSAVFGLDKSELLQIVNDFRHITIQIPGPNTQPTDSAS